MLLLCKLCGFLVVSALSRDPALNSNVSSNVHGRINLNPLKICLVINIEVVAPDDLVPSHYLFFLLLRIPLFWTRRGVTE